MRDAFSAAIAADIPILTSVSPAYVEAWTRFASPMFVVVPPEESRIEAWWKNTAVRNLAG